jgi:hypothetical protein
MKFTELLQCRILFRRGRTIQLLFMPDLLGWKGPLLTESSRRFSIHRCQVTQRTSDLCFATWEHSPVSPIPREIPRSTMRTGSLAAE